VEVVEVVEVVAVVLILLQGATGVIPSTLRLTEAAWPRAVLLTWPEVVGLTGLVICVAKPTVWPTGFLAPSITGNLPS
jgi:hypothetical protein